MGSGSARLKVSTQCIPSVESAWVEHVKTISRADRTSTVGLTDGRSGTSRVSRRKGARACGCAHVFRSAPCGKRGRHRTRKTAGLSALGSVRSLGTASLEDQEANSLSTSDCTAVGWRREGKDDGPRTNARDWISSVMPWGGVHGGVRSRINNTSPRLELCGQAWRERSFAGRLATLHRAKRLALLSVQVDGKDHSTLGVCLGVSSSAARSTRVDANTKVVRVALVSR